MPQPLEQRVHSGIGQQVTCFGRGQIAKSATAADRREGCGASQHRAQLLHRIGHGDPIGIQSRGQFVADHCRQGGGATSGNRDGHRSQLKLCGCCEIARRVFVDVSPVDERAGRMRIPHNRVVNSLRLMCAEVMPQLRD